MSSSAFPTHTTQPVPSTDVFTVRGRTAIVTGVSSGLGRRFAECLLEHGAQVIPVGRKSNALYALAEHHGSDRVHPLVADVSDDVAVEDAVEDAITWSGGIDILVNNAGITTVLAAEQEEPTQFRRTVDVNLHGVYAFCHHVGRHMLERQRGSIVNLSSINGLVASGTIPEASYCASKAAVLGLTRELAAQWARRGVRVNALAPGYFPSRMTAELFASDAGQRRLRRTPMGRGGNTAELDGPLLFLASDASSYVTGQTLVVDGGWTII